MSEAREKRNEVIRRKYVDLVKAGKGTLDAIEEIFNSPENKDWCLRHDTIRLIVTYKNYGKTTKERAQC